MKDLNFKTKILLIVVMLIQLSLNFNKAFHIDDAAHLEMAIGARSNPLKSMSVKVNWAYTTEPAHKLNNPHLFFWLLAMVIKLFDPFDIPLHIFTSLFTLLATYLTYIISYKIDKKITFTATVLFALNASVLPMQNIMLDIPLTAMWLLFFYFLLKNEPDSLKQNHIIACIILGFSILIKYTSLILIPVFIVNIFIRKKPKFIIYLSIPLIFVLIWSLINYMDYGGIHILNRKINPFNLKIFIRKLLAYLIVIGAVCPFGLFFLVILAKKFTKPSGYFLHFLILFIFIAFPLICYTFKINQNKINLILRVLFFISAISTITGILWIFLKKLKSPYSEKKLPFVLFLFLILIETFFVVRYGPLIAVRYATPIMPYIAIFSALIFKNSSKSLRNSAIFVTALYGILLGISDYYYANIYRIYPAKLKTMLLKTYQNKRIWFTGHWGWQWYAKKAGFSQFDPLISKPAYKDIFICPRYVDYPYIKDIVLEKKSEIIVPFNILHFFSTANEGSFYSSSIEKLPFTFSKQPIEVFEIYLYHGKKSKKKLLSKFKSLFNKFITGSELYEKIK